ncbi:Cupin domain protein [Amycolatopsis xylanica]|uniref:Cupin domain protein n=1 Tax=Amycolatopsis xylanica TaxID=589385 RepID=A0A1H3SXG8_9PSEU|nr:cupin domain-containing protein [Amycolatopsis xylanica]SDZ42251.1 Cupin domain protein [Amycolatopsis xylanica]
MRTSVRGTLAGAAVLGALLVPATAEATPGSGVTGVILSKTTLGKTDYILREITIQPGGGTGWHFHDGTLYAFVKAGTLTHNDADCVTQDVYRAGATFVEPKGADKVHIGRNLGSTPIVLDVLYVLPTGSPLAEDAPNPGCDFQ